MPAEIRHILFRQSEVVHAIREYQACIKQPISAGSIVHCGPEADGDGRVARFRLTVEEASAKPNAPGHVLRQELVIEATTLAAALILYCRNRGIPLPASADKSLQKFGEQIGLIATYNPKQAALPSAASLRA